MTSADASVELLTAESFVDLLAEFDTFIFGADGELRAHSDIAPVILQ